MAIDFFKDEEPVECSLFGICDDEDEAIKTPAYVDTDEARKVDSRGNQQVGEKDHVYCCR